MNYVHVFYRLSVGVAASSVLALFLLLAPPVTHAQCNGCPPPGTYNPMPYPGGPPPNGSYEWTRPFPAPWSSSSSKAILEEARPQPFNFARK
jgi:hypothetical protein